MITVFTPIYNRASFLHGIYECLCQQTYKDFEWVIVDDGSSDDAQDVVNKLHDTKRIRIRYFRQENGGKHRAINQGVRVAKGELFLILDSDDLLPANSLYEIETCWRDVRNNRIFGGVCGLMAHRNGEIIGNFHGRGTVDMTYLTCRYKKGFQGDMAEVFRTDVMREFPFPEYVGEKFCPEALVWNRIATKYQLRYFDQVVYYRDYIDGGLTDRIVYVRMRSPQASTTCYKEITSYQVPILQKLKAAANYWRFRFCAHDKCVLSKLKWYWNVMAPLGCVLYLRDRVEQKGLNG